MPQSILELIFKTSKSGQGGKAAAAELKELKSGVGELSSGLLGINLASIGVIGAITGVAAGMKAAVGDTVAYAEQVRDLGRISGATAEDTSRLIQTADDLKVEYGILEQAAKTLAKKGIALTTEELAKSADEYLAIEDAGGRAKYATEKFGKAGLDLTKVLEAGGQAIRDMAKDQSASLILTEKQVKEARRFEQAQDAVEDSFMGLKLTIGNAVIPVVADLLEQMDDLVNGEAKLQQANVDSSKTFAEYTAKVKERQALVQKQDPVLAWIQDLTKSNQGLTETEYNVAKGMYNIRDEGTRFVTAMELNKTASDRLNESLEKNKTKDLALDMQNYSKQLLFNQASAGLDAEASRILAASMGMIDEKTAKAMDAMAKLKEKFEKGTISAYEYALGIAEINKEVDGLHDKDITITTTYIKKNGSVGFVDPGTGSKYASGGSFTIPPGYENHTWPVGPNKWAESGETVTIKPKGGARGTSDRALVGTVIINNGMDLESFKRMLVAATRG